MVNYADAMPNRVSMTAAEWVALLIDRGPALREAGVLEVSAESGFFARLTIAPPPLITIAPGTSSSEGDPLSDPATYPGGVVPGYSFEHEIGDDE